MITRTTCQCQPTKWAISAVLKKSRWNAKRYIVSTFKNCQNCQNIQSYQNIQSIQKRQNRQNSQSKNVRHFSSVLHLFKSEATRILQKKVKNIFKKLTEEENQNKDENKQKIKVEVEEVETKLKPQYKSKYKSQYKSNIEEVGTNNRSLNEQRQIEELVSSSICNTLMLYEKQNIKYMENLYNEILTCVDVLNYKEEEVDRKLNELHNYLKSKANDVDPYTFCEKNIKNIDKHIYNIIKTGYKNIDEFTTYIHYNKGKRFRIVVGILLKNILIHLKQVNQRSVNGKRTLATRAQREKSETKKEIELELKEGEKEVGEKEVGEKEVGEKEVGEKEVGEKHGKGKGEEAEEAKEAEELEMEKSRTKEKANINVASTNISIDVTGTNVAGTNRAIGKGTSGIIIKEKKNGDSNLRGRYIKKSILKKQREEQILENQSKMIAASEIIHMGSLLHDDVVDEANYRRGALTLHKKFSNKVSILSGDFLLARAGSVLSSFGNPEICKRFSYIVESLIKGEFLQTNLNFNNIEDALKIYLIKSYHKTAALFSHAFACIAILAFMNENIIKYCFYLGLHIGMAFQLYDDFLDFSPIGKIQKQNNKTQFDNFKKWSKWLSTSNTSNTANTSNIVNNNSSSNSESGSTGTSSLNDLQNGIKTAPLFFSYNYNPKDILSLINKKYFTKNDIDNILFYIKNTNSMKKNELCSLMHIKRACHFLSLLIAHCNNSNSNKKSFDDQKKIKENSAILINLVLTILSRKTK